MVQSGFIFTRSDLLQTLVHPERSVTVTEYNPEVFTLIQFEVDPVFQRYVFVEFPMSTQKVVD